MRRLTAASSDSVKSPAHVNTLGKQKVQSTTAYSNHTKMLLHIDILDLTLIQAPWVRKGKIKGLPRNGMTLYQYFHYNI